MTPKTQSQLWQLKNSGRATASRDKNPLILHDYVRISPKGVFQKKNYDQNWSDEVFRIVGIDTSQVPTMYIIEDHGGQVIKGKFYKQELQSLGPTPPTVLRIEKVIRTKGTGAYKQMLVKWWGYDSSHNSWIKASHLQKNT